MTHWCAQYIGQPWTERRDCGKWFRIWSRVQFGRRVPPIILDPGHITHSAARTMASDIEGRFGYGLTDTPAEGDAVFLSQRKRPHHIGMVVNVDGKKQVLHALEGYGVILSDSMDLRLGGWKIAGYWTPMRSQ